MDRRALWNRIESRLESSNPEWRERVHQLGQVKAVEDRSAGRDWSDDEVFEGIVMAVLSADTGWSRIEKIQAELPALFSGFSLESYAKVSDTRISDHFLPWFKDRKAGSRSRGLYHLVDTAGILAKHSREHRSADDYFTSLVHRCGDDPKQAALHLGCPGEYKLPSLGVALAAEALKNLGFDVAKPDRHVMRALGSFGLVHFDRWSSEKDGKRAKPKSQSKEKLLAVMTEVEKIAKAAEEPVVLVDNAIWLLCARGEAYLTNPQLAELAGDCESPGGRAESLQALIRSWMSEDDAGEQRETLETLIRGLDEERPSGHKLFPEELKGTTW